MVKFMNSNFLKRTISTVILLPLLILLILKGSSTLLLIILFLCLSIAWYEWVKLFNFSLHFYLYGFILLLLSLFLLDKFSTLYIFFLIFFLAYLPSMFNFEREAFIKTFYPFLIGLIYLYLSFASLKLLIQGYPRELLLFLFCVVFGNDTGAYLAGRKWGKSPFFPEISPKKTWEGFWGGLILALIVGIFLNKLYSLWSTLSLITIVLMLTLFAVMGDLFESSIKRSVGKKDAGALIPGHGGILDRLDGVFFASPIYVFFLEVLNYGVPYRLGL